MGIPGLTSFIKNNSTQYFENHQLANTLVIIDGFALTNFLYRMHENQTSAFGGDYDIIATVYIDFINLFLRCEVIPVFVFDGAYEQRKIETIVNRMSQRIQLYGNGIKTSDCMPYFGSDILFDILNDMDIPHVNCDFEADAEIVALAKLLNCPVISRDSDFYVNTVPYIPLDMITLDFQSTVINCRLYKVEKLLNEFGGLHSNYLPLVAALLGNDYIRPDTFSTLLRLRPGTFNCGLKLKRITEWLRRQKDINNALYNMTYNLSHNRDYINNQIKNIINEYKNTDSQYLAFILQCKRMTAYQEGLKKYLKPKESNILPLWLENYYRKGIINSEVMTIITMKRVFFKVQIEDYQKPPYYEVSFDILKIVFGLLIGKNDSIPTLGRKNGLNTGQYKIKSQVIDPYVPLADIIKTDLEYRKNIILNLTGIKNFNGVPKEWELFVLILIYWAIQTNNKKSKHVNALIVCAMTFNIIKKIDTKNKTLENFANKSIIEENIIKVKKEDCENAINNLKKYFSVNQCDNKNLYYKIIHPFAQFQSCAYFFMILNSLLDFPYNQCRIENFFKGSLLYNLCVEMEHTNAEEFISQKLFYKLDSLNKVYKSISSHVDILLSVSKRKMVTSSSNNPKPNDKRKLNNKRKPV